MRTRTKKKVYSTTLPGTPCTEDMKAQIVAIAEEGGVSVADVQRQAFALFLSNKVSNAHKKIASRSHQN